MKLMKKRRAFASCILAALLLFSACNSSVTYKSDVSAETIMKECASPLASYELLAAVDEDYMTYRMMLDASAVESYSVYIQNAGTSIDEIGIFQAYGDDTTTVASMVEDYLTRRNEEWTGQYLVEEYPKLENAEYRVFGRYVIYAILSEDDKADLFSAVETFLTEE